MAYVRGNLVVKIDATYRLYDSKDDSETLRPVAVPCAYLPHRCIGGVEQIERKGTEWAR